MFSHATPCQGGVTRAERGRGIGREGCFWMEGGAVGEQAGLLGAL